MIKKAMLLCAMFALVTPNAVAAIRKTQSNPVANWQAQNFPGNINGVPPGAIINEQNRQREIIRQQDEANAIRQQNNLKEARILLARYDKQISQNPRNASSYNGRAIVKETRLRDYQGALSDYNQAIVINPKYADAYFNRAHLKDKKLNDIQGALSDYNQSISFKPKDFHAYTVRAILKEKKLNDTQGALADYSQAIVVSPKYPEAYGLRAVLKYQKLNDRAGAIKDFRQVARLYREQGNTKKSQQAIEVLQELGATE
jgi:tetratricopeptide (TPR) repeat protein